MHCPSKRATAFSATSNKNWRLNWQLYAEGFYSKRDFVRFGAAPTSTLTVPTTNFYNKSGVATPLSVLYSFINDLRRNAGQRL